MSAVPASPAITPVRVEAEKRSRFNPLSDLTAEKLTQQLDEFRAGILRPLALTMEAVEERDDTLACVVPKAKAAVARHGWQVMVIETEDAAQAAQAEVQREVLEFFYNHLRVTSALDQDELGGFALLLRQMMDAKGKRYAVHNLVWQPGADGRYTATAHFVPLWFFENTTGKLRFIRQPFGYYGEDLEPGAWLVTKGAGLMLPSVVAWMFKNLPMKDWLIYCARHGMPGIEGVTDAVEGTEEFTRLKEAVTAAATGQLAWIRNRSSEINAIQFGAQGELPYPKLIERMDRALAAIWRGGDLSTMSKDGQAVGTNAQAGESDAMEQDDAAWLSETLQMKLDRLVLDYVFGTGTPALAYVKVLTAKRQNLDADLKVDEFLLKHQFKLGVKSAAERYSRTLAGSDEELLQAGSSASAGGLQPPPEEPAVNEAASGQHSAVSDQLAGSLGVPATWLAPVADLLREIEAKAADQSLSDADLQAFLTQAAARVPELFGQMDVAGLAEAMEASLGQAVIAGVRDSLRAGNSQPGHPFYGNQHADGAGGGGADAPEVAAAKSKVRDFLDQRADEVAFAKVAPDVAAKIKAATGQDVSGYQHLLHKDGLIHINKQHGVGREDQAHHLPITRDDIERIPEIVLRPDKVEDAGSDARGRKVKYTKRTNGTTTYIEQILREDKVLATKTMWKEKSPGQRATPEGGGAQTSKTSGNGGNKA